MRIILVSPSFKVYQFCAHKTSVAQDFLISKEIFSQNEHSPIALSSYIDKFVGSHLSKGAISNVIVKPFPSSQKELRFEKDINPVPCPNSLSSTAEKPLTIMIDCIKKVMHSSNYLETPNYINFIDIDNCLSSHEPSRDAATKLDAYIHLIENKIFINEEIRVGPELIQNILNNLKAKIDGSPMEPLRLPTASRFCLQSDGAWKIHRVSPYHQQCGSSLSYFIQSLNYYGFMFDFDILDSIREQSLKNMKSKLSFTDDERAEDCPVFQKNMEQLTELFIAMQEKVLVSSVVGAPSLLPSLTYPSKI